MRLWLGALLALGLSAAAIFVCVFAPSSGEAKMLAKPVDSRDYSNGNKDASVTVVVYSDFQCPNCAAFNSVMQKVEKDYAGTVRFVHRHFPLPQHGYSPLAAFAAEAAGKQGKYFQMRDRLFDTAGQWSGAKDPLAYFDKLALELQLDVQRFRTDSKSKEVMDIVVEHFASAVNSGCQETPSVFVNGRLLGSVTEQQLRRKLDESIQSR